MGESTGRLVTTRRETRGVVIAALSSLLGHTAALREGYNRQEAQADALATWQTLKQRVWMLWGLDLSAGASAEEPLSQPGQEINYEAVLALATLLDKQTALREGYGREAEYASALETWTKARQKVKQWLGLDL